MPLGTFATNKSINSIKSGHSSINENAPEYLHQSSNRKTEFKQNHNLNGVANIQEFQMIPNHKDLFNNYSSPA